MDFRAFSLMAVFNLTALVTSDLFSDIESFDWDKKLKDLDTIINSVDTDDDDDDYNVGAGEGTDKSSMGDTLDMLSDLLGGGDECTYKCKNGKFVHFYCVTVLFTLSILSRPLTKNYFFLNA